jgi:hypothetical protein
MSRFCAGCGVQVDASAAFCPSCGQVLVVAAPVAVGAEATQVLLLPGGALRPAERQPLQLAPDHAPMEIPEQDRPQNDRRRNWWGIAILGVIGALLVAALVLLTLNDLAAHHKLAVTRLSLAATRHTLVIRTDALATTSQALSDTKGELASARTQNKNLTKQLKSTQKKLNASKQSAKSAQRAAAAARNQASNYAGQAAVAYTQGYSDGYNSGYTDGWYGFPYRP